MEARVFCGRSLSVSLTYIIIVAMLLRDYTGSATASFARAGRSQGPLKRLPLIVTEPRLSGVGFYIHAQ
jgi:hypothetical protein